MNKFAADRINELSTFGAGPRENRDRQILVPVDEFAFNESDGFA